MAKVALLIGVSEYEPGLNPLPGAVKDVEAMQLVLNSIDIGSFNEVKTLLNPDPRQMQSEIEALFSDRARDDLVLLYFSGHGLRDDSGKFFFSTRDTRTNPRGDLIRSTAVPANFVQEIMSHSRSKRQILILDCCFSGAFADGMTAKNDRTIDVKLQLGGRGRAVLTSSNAIQYSYEQENADLSVYTRYVVEGLETGAADLDEDGLIDVQELHEYAQRKVQASSPTMNPAIYVVEEGFQIVIAQAFVSDPKLKYRREVEHFASQGEISYFGRSALDVLRENLHLTQEESAEIEADVVKPYQEYRRKLNQYQELFLEAAQRENPISEGVRLGLERVKQGLKLRDEDVHQIESLVLQQNSVLGLGAIPESLPPTPVIKNTFALPLGAPFADAKAGLARSNPNHSAVPASTPPVQPRSFRKPILLTLLTIGAVFSIGTAATVLGVLPFSQQIDEWLKIRTLTTPTTSPLPGTTLSPSPGVTPTSTQTMHQGALEQSYREALRQGHLAKTHQQEIERLQKNRSQTDNQQSWQSVANDWKQAVNAMKDTRQQIPDSDEVLRQESKVKIEDYQHAERSALKTAGCYQMQAAALNIARTATGKVLKVTQDLKGKKSLSQKKSILGKLDQVSREWGGAFVKMRAIGSTCPNSRDATAWLKTHQLDSVKKTQARLSKSLR